VAGANNHYIIFILEFFSLHFKRNYTLKVHFIQADKLSLDPLRWLADKPWMTVVPEVIGLPE
jgi:hypothetical protein